MGVTDHDKGPNGNRQPTLQNEAAALFVAQPVDRPLILPMATAFWTEDGLNRPDGLEDVVATLLNRPDWGQIYLIAPATTPSLDRICGYAVMCWGYSLMYGGRDAFLDELYLAPHGRNRGLGRATLELLAAHLAETQGVMAIHLEVYDDNQDAARLYARAGYERMGRLMSKRLR